MLDGDAAAERGDPVDLAVADRLGMVEEPVDALEGNVAVHLLEDVERARDRLVIGRVQPPRPSVLGQQADHRFELGLHVRRHFGALDPEVLEVGGGIDQHLARAVVAIGVVALTRA